MESVSICDGISGLRISNVSTENGQGVSNSSAPETVKSSDKYDDGYAIADVVKTFLRPLKESILKAINDDKLVEQRRRYVEMEDKGPALKTLLYSLCQFISEPDLIYADKGLLRRIYSLMNCHFKIEEGQSDLDDFLEYKPSEIMAYKAIQLFIAFVLPDPQLFVEELFNFKTLIEDNRVARDGRAEGAYLFLYNTFKILYSVLAGEPSEKEECLLTDFDSLLAVDFESLAVPVKCVVHALSVVLLKQFRIKAKEQILRMRKVVQDDQSSHEWCLYLADMLRLKRRETATSRAHWATDEEIVLVATAFSMEPENPFVQLTILDTVIGCVRDANGRFRCGNIKLLNKEEAIRFLQDSSKKLTTNFPKNVMINSVVSDYFARYVPFLYFDVDLSLRLLMTAYNLNPLHPKTTHRLGILHRMSFGDIDESLKWFEKTIELDPTHYRATMNYFKTILGKPEKYDAAMIIQKTLESSASAGWSAFELSDLFFYHGLAYFMGKNRQKALNWWKQAAQTNEAQFTLVDIQDTFLFYDWDDKLISSDKLRLWIKEELDDFSKKEKAGEPFNREQKKFVEIIFALMLGRRVPYPATNKHPFKRLFPKAFLGYFVER